MTYVRKFWLITDLAKEYNATLRSVKKAMEDAGLLRNNEPTDLAWEKDVVDTRPRKKGSCYTWRFNYVKRILDNADLEPKYEDKPPTLTEQYNDMLEGTEITTRYLKRECAWGFYKNNAEIAKMHFNSVYGGKKRGYFEWGDLLKDPFTIEEAIALLRGEDFQKMKRRRINEFGSLFNKKLEAIGLHAEYDDNKNVWDIKRGAVKIASYDAVKFCIEACGMREYIVTVNRAVEILRKITNQVEGELA